MSTMTGFPSMSAVAGGAVIASASSAFREQVVDRLNGRCRPVQQAMGGADALAKLESGDWQMLFLDRRVPDLDTEELIAIIQRRFAGVQVVLLDSGSPSGGRKDDQDGDRDKARDNQECAEKERGSPPLSFLPEAVGNVRESGAGLAFEPLPGMIGASDAMRRVYRMARLVAPRTTTVLVAGPTGSGKELVARALHLLSPRAGKVFVAVNCAAIPEALLESELFGYARGAFTGAVQAQAGRVAAAHGGTLFLDEVSELPLGMQAKLLRFLEQKEIQRLGGAEVARVDVRVIAASNVDLAARTGRGGGGAGRCARHRGQQRRSGGAHGAGRVSRGSVLPPLRVSAGAAAAERAPRRHYSAGRAFSRMHGDGHRWALPALELRCDADSRSPSLEGKRARAAARDGAGVDSGRGCGHGGERASLLSLPARACATGRTQPFVRHAGQLRGILASPTLHWPQPCKPCLQP